MRDMEERGSLKKYAEEDGTWNGRDKGDKEGLNTDGGGGEERWELSRK